MFTGKTWMTCWRNSMHTSRNNENSAQGGETYRAGCPSLGARLLAAAGLVRSGRVVADIGCDHGKLAVYLGLQSRVPRVIAADVRPMPLARAKGLVKQNACEHKVECRLGDGLACLAQGEATEIIIAGMSGQTIQEIMESCPWAAAQENHFILIPTTRHTQLRKWLYEAGYVIQQEVPVYENRKYYTVLSARYTGQRKEQTPLFCTIGLMQQNDSPQAKGYITCRLRHLQKKARASLPEEERAALEKLTQEVAACLE